MGLATLPRHHPDPFDRILIAHAAAEGMTLLTVDEVMVPCGVPVLRM